MTVAREETKVAYGRAALPSQETASLHNRDIAHTYTMKPTPFIEVAVVKMGNAAVVTWDAPAARATHSNAPSTS